MRRWLLPFDTMRHLSLVLFIINLALTSFNLARGHYAAAGYTAFFTVYSGIIYLFVRFMEKRERDE